MDAREIAELLVNGKLHAINDYGQREVVKLAKAYLDLVNAEPVAEIAVINITAGTIINVPDRAKLKSGDKLYLRKE